jgi:hypothetical protein
MPAEDRFRLDEQRPISPRSSEASEEGGGSAFAPGEQGALDVPVGDDELLAE